MSKDIRSYFSIGSKRSDSNKPETKPPEPKKRRRRKIESDDEEEPPKPSKAESEVKAVDVFGTAPVKRKRSDKNAEEQSVHESDDFAQTLQRLDTKNAAKKTKIEPSNGTPSSPDRSQSIKTVDEIGPSPVSDKKRKRKLSDNATELTDEDRYERKRFSALLYKKYLNRSGPKHPGSKTIPDGEPNCLQNCTFLITGVLDSFERDEISDVIKRFGGEMKQSLSGKVTHLICGEDAGPQKIAKAESLGISIITEDEFLNLIRDSKNVIRSTPTKNSPKKEKADLKKTKLTTPKKKNSPKDEKKQKLEKIKKSTPTKIFSKNEKKEKVNLEKIKLSTQTNNLPKDKEKVRLDLGKIKKENITDAQTSTQKSNGISDEATKSDNKFVSLVDKYRPTCPKQIIGQQGESSCLNKLRAWLSKWYVKRKDTKKAPINPWNKGDGSSFNAALLCGPPGVGKTTTANLVCKELGFDIVEFNASDTRSKNLLKEQVTELTTTNSLFGFVNGKKAISKKHVIIMDEVDGMAGNEDRGGMQELISLIKTTRIPIICICNDKSSPKMRSFLNYCYDMTFAKPKLEQIKSSILSICFKENIKIPQKSLDEIITGGSHDIRQILNLLSLWSASDKNLKSDSISKDSVSSKKDIKLGPWTVCGLIFSEKDQKNMSLQDKSDLFFHDYNLIPLFVQQNYLNVVPDCPEKQKLSRFAEAADSLSFGDLIESKIRGSNAWSLLPVQAMFSSVIPGSVLSGRVGARIDFPAWLGQNSRKNKMDRLVQEIHAHTRLSTSGSKLSIKMDYAKHMRDAILLPLSKNGVAGVDEALETLEKYHLLREDLDSLTEVTDWHRRDEIRIDSKVKAALTKKYNKNVAMLPYSQSSTRKLTADSEENQTDSGFVQGEVSDDSDVESDAMIKKPRNEKKPSTASKNIKKNKPNKKK